MNKQTSFLFQKFISFLFVTFIACIAGIFSQENAGAQQLDAPNGGGWGQGWGSGSIQIVSPINQGADSYTITQPDPILTSGCAQPVKNSDLIPLPIGTLQTSDGVTLNNTVTIGVLVSPSGSLWQNSNQLAVGNSRNTQPSLTIHNSYSGGTSIGGSATIDLAGHTMNVSAIELADGSKIINGMICLNNDLILAKEIKQELQFLGVVPDQNGVFDLSGRTYFISDLLFENGGKIMNGWININANNPADQMIRELPASE